MDLLRDWVENLILLVIVATLCEMILPEGSPRQFVRLVLGLVVVLAIVHPLAAFVNQDRWLTELELGARRYEAGSASEDWLNDAKRVESAGRAAATSSLQAETGQSVAALLLLVPGVDNASAAVRLGADGTIAALRVTIESREADRAAVAERVRAFILHAYKLNPLEVQIDVAAAAADSAGQTGSEKG